MFYVSEISRVSPRHFNNELQFLVYKKLAELSISFERVETEEAITMEDCIEIDRKLQIKMVKTLFLCTRNQQELFLFITAGDKRFDSKAFSHALGISRVSFAPEELMHSVLGTNIGAATVFSVLLKSADEVRVVFDQDVLTEEFYGCSDGTTTGYMKIRTEDIINRFLPGVSRDYATIRI